MNEYQLISEILLHEDAYNWAKYKTAQSTIRSRESQGIQTIDKAMKSLHADRSVFDKLPPQKKKELLNKAKKMKSLKRAGKIGAAVVIAGGILKTIEYFKHRGE